MNLTIKQLFSEGQKILLKAQGISCAFDGMELLSFCIKKDKSYIMTHQDEALPSAQCHQYLSLCEKRAKGYPLQYILGFWEFFGIEFAVGEGVLIPRADTEALVEAVLELDFPKDSINILDLCSGSGAIAV
ncbi:MAG: protein-(glutamine-N5) methyltransferase, release factor-specific, partial [Oscillospiraceae bacterium]